MKRGATRGKRVTPQALFPCGVVNVTWHFIVERTTRLGSRLWDNQLTNEASTFPKCYLVQFGKENTMFGPQAHSSLNPNGQKPYILIDDFTSPGFPQK
jgi:hypothetical protein